MSEPTACRLHAALGDIEECPRGWCAFWEKEVGGGRCGLERLGLNVIEEPELARHLLEVRKQLDAVRSSEQVEEILRELERTLPPGLAED